MVDATFCIELLEPWHVLSVSDGVEVLLGYTPEDFLASRVSLRDRIHPDDSGMADRLFSRDIHEGCGGFNLRLRHADGKIRCVRGHCTKSAGPDGGIVLNLSLQDAKSLKAETAGQYSSINLRSVMESIDERLHFKDSNHVLTEANLNLRRALSGAGAEPRDLTGLTDYDLFPEEYADASYRLEQQVFEGSPLAHVVQASVDKAGKTVWTDIRKYPVKDSTGEIIGLFGIARDITDRVLAEQALREQEESLREAQRIAGLGSYVLDIATGGWTSSDVLDEIFGIGKSYERTVAGWGALIHPDDRAMMTAHLLNEVLGQGNPFSKEYRIVRPTDQAERWVHGLGRLEFDAKGKPVILRGTIQDITEHKQAEEALRENKELLQLFIQHAPAALAMFDREMRYLAASRRWLDDFGLSGREIIGRSHYEIFPEIPDRWKDVHRRTLAGETLQADEDPFQREDDQIQWLRWESRPLRAGNGAIGGIMIFSEDITRRKQAEHRLHLAASVFTNASEGIAITDANGTIIEVNESFTGITGYTREEVLGRNPSILSSGRHSKEFYENMGRSLAEKGQWAGEIWNRAKNGKIYAEMLTISALRDVSGNTQQYVALFSDVTAMKEQEQKLEHAAHYDLLTGLPNRIPLTERLHRAVVQSRHRGNPVAVACVDLDDFKGINDRHGRDTGDQLLTAVANRMKLALREGDTLARLGGDEFGAILPELADTSESIEVLTRLLDAVSEPVQVGGLVFQVSASAGITFFPQGEDMDADQLLRQADQAMYQAKLEGKDRYHIFDPRQDRSVRGHHEELERIRQALESKEFVLYYQPKVNMCSGQVLGAEALIRWRHPERGLLLPAQFLPVVDGHPLAIELGEWVIDSALTQMERWRAAGLEIPVSVNVGAQQLQQADFVDRLGALLSAHPAIAPSSLELEVLESNALQDVAQVAQLIHACGSIGVSFALDDFGTGYSSLTYFRRLPARVLKIDQSFVHDMLDDPEDLTILEGVLGLAAAFRRQAVAEGVESVEQGLMLLRMGCQLAQGYGIARPMPADELPGWLTGWQPSPQWAGVSPFNLADRALLYAGVEHRAWIVGIEAFLEGRRHMPSPWDARQCRLGAWLHGDGLTGHGGLPTFQHIETLHRRTHALAAEILAQNADGGRPEALSRLTELYALRDALLGELNALMREI